MTRGETQSSSIASASSFYATRLTTEMAATFRPNTSTTSLSLAQAATTQTVEPGIICSPFRCSTNNSPLKLEDCISGTEGGNSDEERKKNDRHAFAFCARGARRAACRTRHRAAALPDDVRR